MDWNKIENLRRNGIKVKVLIWGLLIGMQLASLGQAAAAIAASAKDASSVIAVSAATANTQALVAGAVKAYPTGANAGSYQKTPHVIDLNRWGIRNDGTKPVETTKGINNALQWASKNGITATTLPAGTYLIDKDSRINMVANMLFDLPADVVLQKESNGKELYYLFHIGYGANNVTIRGGVYKGDRDTHDYSKKDNAHSSGTHEGGYGIAVEGADSVTIEGVTSTHFTGDGLVLGGYGTMVQDLYENSFVSGTFNDKGKPLASKEHIRTVKPFLFDHAIFKTEREFELSNPINLPGTFDVYIFDNKNKHIQTLKGKKMRDKIQIPSGAGYAHFVFKKADAKGAYTEVWNRVVSTNVIVKDSEFGYNRRQGITVGGADVVLIQGNELHHTKGTAPQSGIDLEGGYHQNGNLNSNITIKDNDFHDNASYDLILYDGENALVQNNRLASKGAIGLAISEPFNGALIVDNLFDGSRIMAYQNAVFLNNRMERSLASFFGPNIKIDGMEFVDAVLSISSTQPYGVTASNITITSKDKTMDSGLSLWGKRVRLNDITISGGSKLHEVSGGVEPGSIINNLKVTNYNATSGLSLPPAIYNNCEFSGAEGGKFGGIGINLGGKYVFNNCEFTFSSTAISGIIAEHPELDLTVKNSRFELLGNSPAISVQSAQNVLIEDNTIVANQLSNDKTEVIRLNDYWKREEANDILKAVIRRNSITANLAAIGISTVYAGTGAPPYTVEYNTLINAKLALKENDINRNNTLK